MTQPKSEMLFVRVSPEAKMRFTERAARFDMTASELVRELVTGFIEGRVTIVPPENKESLYEPRKQD